VPYTSLYRSGKEGQGRRLQRLDGTVVLLQDLEFQNRFTLGNRMPNRRDLPIMALGDLAKPCHHALLVLSG
jgi:hypothetical protein